MTRSGAVWLWLLLPVAAWAEDDPEVPTVEEERRLLDETWRNLLRVEATSLSFLPRAGVGTHEVFLQVEPTLVFERGAEFGLNLGAPVRLSMWGEGTSLVRRKDWDSLSDWGQLVRGLKLMGTGGTLLFPTPEGTLRPGAFASVGLGMDNAR